MHPGTTPPSSAGINQQSIMKNAISHIEWKEQSNNALPYMLQDYEKWINKIQNGGAIGVTKGAIGKAQTHLGEAVKTDFTIVSFYATQGYYQGGGMPKIVPPGLYCHKEAIQNCPELLPSETSLRIIEIEPDKRAGWFRVVKAEIA